MSEDLSTFYVEYQFAKISGGPVLKRTINALPAVVALPDPGRNRPLVLLLLSVLLLQPSLMLTVNDDNKYELNGVEKAGIAGSVGDTFLFDLSDPSLAGHPLGIFTDAS